MVAEEAETFGDSLDEALCEADLKVLSGAYLDHQRQAARRIVADGLWGWFDDDKAAFRDWGFDPAAIAVPVSLWHGAEDRFVPPPHGDWLAERIPGARLHQLAGHGHISLFAELYPAALDELIAAAAPAP
jgi:pimeloyl-ACP methyl ester carboxylesterase